jgi:ABC-type sugar transport system, periplasmic component
MKKLLTVLVSTLLLVSLVACGAEEAPVNQTKNIVLTYADWGDQELNQILIDAFMVEYPNIRVELRQDITGAGAAFTESLLNAQSANVLPDVFAIDNVPTGLSNGMLLDVTESWDADPDTKLVYPNIANAAVYNDKRFAIPSFQFIRGIYINLTLLDYYNIPIPDKDWKYDEFVDLAIQLRQAGQKRSCLRN